MVIDLVSNRIIDCNINAYRRLGYTKSELLRMSVPDFDDSFSEVSMKKDSYLIMNEIVYKESSHKRKDGSLLPVEIGAKVLEQQGKNVLLAFVRDIAECKKIEHEKEEYVQKLQKPLTKLKFFRELSPSVHIVKRYGMTTVIGIRWTNILQNTLKLCSVMESARIAVKCISPKRQQQKNLFPLLKKMFKAGNLL